MLRSRRVKLPPTIRHAWFQKTWNIRKPGAKFCVVLFIEFLPYIGFWNENPLYQNVQHTHEQRKYALQCVSHICYRQQIKLDCVTNMLQCSVHDDETSSVQVKQLLLKLAMQNQQFLYRNSVFNNQHKVSSMFEHSRRPFPLCIVTCIKFCFIYIYKIHLFIYLWGNVILSLPCVWFSVDLPVLGVFFNSLCDFNFIHMRVEQMHISWSNVTECVCVLCDILVCMLVLHTQTRARVDQKVKNPPYFQLQDVSLIVTLSDWEGFLRLAWI
jgi:hypothetical protein